MFPRVPSSKASSNLDLNRTTFEIGQMGEPNDHSQEQAAIDKALRIAELQAELASLTGEPIHPHLAENDDVDDLESWMSGLSAIESDQRMPLYDILQLDRKFTPTPLERIRHPADLHENLWLLIYALASLRVFIEETDHLSEQELYHVLLHRLLSLENPRLPASSSWNTRFSVCELCDAQQPIPIHYLRFYADEEMREEIARQYPGTALPKKESLPFDRDAYLPTF